MFLASCSQVNPWFPPLDKALGLRMRGAILRSPEPILGGFAQAQGLSLSTTCSESHHVRFHHNEMLILQIEKIGPELGVVESPEATPQTVSLDVGQH